MEYTRNSDPEYYNKNRARANCGSYALRLREWYDPEDYLENIERLLKGDQDKQS